MLAIRTLQKTLGFPLKETRKRSIVVILIQQYPDILMTDLKIIMLLLLQYDYYYDYYY